MRNQDRLDWYLQSQSETESTKPRIRFTSCQMTQGWNLFWFRPKC